MHLFHSGREFCLTSPVHDMYVGSETECCSCSVHRHISSAHNSDFLSRCDRSIVGIIVGFHQITSCQILVRREHLIGILSRDSHEHRKSGSRSDEYGLKPFILHELVDRRGFADHNVCLELYAEFFHLLDLFRNNPLLRETELRNSVYEHTAKLMQCLEYCHIVSHLCKIACAGQTGRS